MPTNSQTKFDNWKIARIAVLLILLALAAYFFIARTNQPGKYSKILPFAGRNFPANNSVSGQYLAARFSESHHDWQAAYQSVKNAIEKSPQNPNLKIIAMRLAIRLKNIDEAKDYAEQVLKIDPKQKLSNIVLLSYLLKEHQQVRLDRTLQNLTKKQDQIPDISSLVINVINVWNLAEKKDFNKAIAKIDELIGSNNILFNQFLHYQAALIADMGGMKFRAEKEYLAIIKTPVPKSYRFMEGAVSFFRRNGKNDIADKLYKNYLQKYASAKDLPQNPVPIVNNSVEAVAELYAEIGAFLSQNHFEAEAVEYLRLSLYLRSDLLHAQYSLAEVLSELGMEKEAIEIYKNIDQNSIYGRHGQLNIAKNLEKTGLLNEAKAILENIDSKDPDDYEAVITLGDFYVRQQHYSDAVRIYSKVIDRIKEPQKSDWPIFYSRGAAYERMGDWEKAESDLKEALKQEPNQPDVLNYLAFSWAEKGTNLEEAKNMLEIALKQTPDAPQIIDSYGWVLYKLKEYDEAVEYLETAAMYMPNDSVINSHLGDAYWMAGRRNEAKFQWKRALGLKPEPKEVAPLKQKIENGL